MALEQAKPPLLYQHQQHKGQAMSKDLLPMIAGIGLAGATGGLAAPALGAAGGAGAAGAGAGAGLGLAGDALAAQGAAGLLGSAGAAAAGYGAPVAAGIGAAGGTGAVGGTAPFGNNGEFVGNTIESELSANPYTGGFDNLNGIERIGQRVGGLLDDGGLDKLGKFKNAFGGQQEQAQQAQNTEVSGGAVAQQPEQQQGALPNVYGQPQVQLTDEQKRMLMQRQGLMGGYYG
jgi:hypothetical protein